jgi:hypothetical protein
VLSTTALILPALRSAEPGLHFSPTGAYWEAAFEGRSIDLPAFTLETWVRAEPATRKGRVISVQLEGRSRAWIGFPGAQQVEAEGPQGKYRGNLPAGEEWLHLALTMDATTRGTRLYVNGNLAAKRDGANTHRLAGQQPRIRLGADSSGKSGFNGWIHRAALHSRALTAEEVAALAADRGRAPDPSTLWAGWTAPDAPGESIPGAGAHPVELQKVARGTSLSSGSVAPSTSVPSGPVQRLVLVGSGPFAATDFAARVQAWLGAGWQVHALPDSPSAPGASAQTLAALKPQAVMFQPDGSTAGEGPALRTRLLALQQLRGLQSLWLATPLWRKEEGTPGFDPSAKAGALEVALRLASVELGIPLCDLGPPVVDAEGLESAARRIAESVEGRALTPPPPSVAPGSSAVPATSAHPAYSPPDSLLLRVAMVGDKVLEKSLPPNHLAVAWGAGYSVKGGFADRPTMAAGNDRFLGKEGAWKQALAERPQVLILAVPTHDASTHRDAHSAAMRDGLGQLVEEARAAVPGVRIILTLPPPIRPEAKDGLVDARVSGRLRGMASFVAGREQIPLVDFHALLAGRDNLFADTPANSNAPVGVAEELARALREAVEGRLPPPPRPVVRQLALAGDALSVADPLAELSARLGNTWEVSAFLIEKSRLLHLDKRGLSTQPNWAEARARQPDILLICVAEAKEPAKGAEVAAFERDLRALLNQSAAWTPRPRVILALPVPFAEAGAEVKAPERRRGSAADVVERAAAAFRVGRADPARAFTDDTLAPKDNKGRRELGKGYWRALAQDLQALPPPADRR